MPLFFNDATDDPLQFDACDSFAGGQNSDTRSNRLEMNQAALLVNADISKDGLITTRRGTELLGSVLVNGFPILGLHWFDSPAHEYLIACASTSTFRYTGGAWSGWSTYNAGGGTMVQMASLFDRVYFASGTQNLYSFDGTTTTNLNGGGLNEPPADPSMVVAFSNRLFVSGMATDPTAIHISDIASPPTWNTSTNVIRVGYGENDPITCLKPWDGFNLVVFKRNSIFVVDVNPTVSIANWPIEILHRAIGCVGIRAACQVGQDVWFLSDSGVHSIRRTIAGDQREVTVPISQPIQDLIDRINWTSASRAACHFFNNRFFMSVPLDGSTYNNYLIVYDTLNKAWSGYWTGLDVTCMATSADSNDLRLNFGMDNGEVSRWLHSDEDSLTHVYLDFGDTPIATEVHTRAMVFGEALNPKQPFNLALEFHQSFTNEAQVDVTFDENSSTRIAASLNTSHDGLTLPLTLPFTLIGPKVKRRAFSIQHLPNFREMQVKVSSPSNKLALRMVTASAFTETVKIEE